MCVIIVTLLQRVRLHCCVRNDHQVAIFFFLKTVLSESSKFKKVLMIEDSQRHQQRTFIII